LRKTKIHPLKLDLQGLPELVNHRLFGCRVLIADARYEQQPLIGKAEADDLEIGLVGSCPDRSLNLRVVGSCVSVPPA